jgi:hypothetical protein
LGRRERQSAARPDARKRRGEHGDIAVVYYTADWWLASGDAETNLPLRAALVPAPESHVRTVASAAREDAMLVLVGSVISE